MRAFLIILYSLSLAAAIYLLLEKWGGAVLERAKRESRTVQVKLEREFIRVSRKNVFGFCAALLAFIGFVLLTTRYVAIIAASPLIAAGAFQLIFCIYSRRRKKRILHQVPFFLDLVESHTKAGVSFQQALQEITGKVKSPLKEEIEIIRGNINIGLPLPDALRSLYERAPAEETLITYLSISNCLKNGANMREMVAKVKDSLLLKQKAEKKMKAQTAQGKLQGVVLTIMPLALVFALDAVQPGYFNFLLSNQAGRLILAAVFVLLLAGWLLILRIVKPEV